MVEENEKTGSSRRALLQGMLTTAGLSGAEGKTASRTATRVRSPQPIVETTAGKIRGYLSNGVYAFKGVPYGGTTGGAARFQRPSNPTPWTGVRSCVHYGHICPSGNYWSGPQDNAPQGDEDGYLLYRSYWTPAGEDCLRVNVWTPGIIASAHKRPVLVYMHGGGFSGGSGHDLLFGYLNLADIGGEQFANSANAGMLDTIAVLEWVRDNIANFGGDPRNVTIFGQSGGGGKVSALLAMPAAKGLFHKAVIQSWPFYRFAVPQDSTSVATALLAELNLVKSQAAQLCEIPIGRLIDASAAALRKTAPSAPGGRRMGWGPTVDGKTIPLDPTDAAAPALSANVPLLAGTNLNEFVSGVDNPEVDTLSAKQLADRVRERWGDAGRNIVEAYRQEYPNATPFQLWAAISAVAMRQPTFTHAERKAALGGAPVYQYIFSWRTPVLEDRPGTFHACEIAFVFDNAGRCVRQTGGGRAALELSTRVSQAWVNFARHGNPGHQGLPRWPAFEASSRATMFFDDPCFVKNDPEGAGLRLQQVSLHS